MTPHPLLLKQIDETDYAYLRGLFYDEENSFRWRHRGGSLSPDAMIGNLWQNVLYQCLVVDTSENRRMGLISAFGPDFSNGHASLAVVLSSDSKRIATPLIACAAFIDRVFQTWAFRKLYAQVPGWNIDQIHRMGRFAAAEGVLSEHDYLDGKYWDSHIFAIHRASWEARSLALKPLMARHPVIFGA